MTAVFFGYTGGVEMARPLCNQRFAWPQAIGKINRTGKANVVIFYFEEDTRAKTMLGCAFLMIGCMILSVSRVEALKLHIQGSTNCWVSMSNLFVGRNRL